MRNKIKALRAAVENDNLPDAEKLLTPAIKMIETARSKGVIKKETASRYLSRLAKLLNRAKAGKSAAAPSA
jgi:small subunit ribosomal protein S20